MGKARRMGWCWLLAAALCVAAGGVVAQSVDEAISHYEKGDYRTALSQFQAPAARGDAIAQFYLGYMHSHGQGVAKNEPLAVYWYTKAAEQGLPEAQHNLALKYEDGLGVPKDNFAAAFWYTKAAEQGYISAQFNLALKYEDGLGVPKNDFAAAFWYTKAAEQGHISAQVNLAILYAQGRGVPKNAREAFRWRKMAAERGSEVAQAALGVHYDRGDGIPKDEQTAYFWYLLASAAGDENARYLVEHLETRLTPQQRADAQAAARVWKPASAVTVAPTPAPAQTASSSTGPDSTGTGFRIARDRFVTNHHVVEDCRRVRVDDTEAKIGATDARMDLALLSAPVSGPIASVRVNRPLVGEAVTVAGFPLQGLLSGFQVTTGTLASLSGLGGDTSQFQITAPVQAGNSGGPVLDSAGRVMGVVVAKLNAIRTARVTGDLPQNVNFAIGGNALRSFLDATDVNYQTSLQDRPLPTTAVAQQAQAFTVRVECWK